MLAFNRRFFLKLTAATALIGARLVHAQDEPIRIGITPVFLTERISLLRDWGLYLEQQLKRRVVFEQSDSYRDIINSLLAERLEFAWICGFPYVTHKKRLQLTSVPLYNGKPLYRSYLIVSADDTATQNIADLRDRVFVYTDPDSNSGFLVPRYELSQQGLDLNHFFRKTFFTGGHRNAIEAVSTGLADAANVDDYVWETLARFKPEITRNTRIVTQSRQFGFPPIVAGPVTPAQLNQQLRTVLVGMKNTPAGIRLLDRFNLDGFTPGRAEIYDDIATMAKAIGANRDIS